MKKAWSKQRKIKASQCCENQDVDRSGRTFGKKCTSEADKPEMSRKVDKKHGDNPQSR
jgi:hypothetical protein